MFDDTSQFNVQKDQSAVVLQRTKGLARCTFKLRDQQTVLDDLMQSGSFKVRFPNMEKGHAPEAVLLNTAGGLTGGDMLSFEGGIAASTAAVFTTQASERAYRALSGEAHVVTALTAGEGSHLEWLPQETILFNGSRLSRTFDVDLADGAKLLAHESIVFGRTAMGEVVEHGYFSDLWRVRRNNKLIHADAVRLDGEILKTLSRATTLNGANAMTTVLYIGADASERLQGIQEFISGISPAEGVAGVSAWSGKLIFRAVATGGAALRSIVQPLLVDLRDGRDLPRVWSI